MSEYAYAPARKWAAWAVHLLTATGAVAGLMALLATSHHKWVHAFGFMGLTLFIDSVDGALARLCNVKLVLPQFDGELLDNIVDYFCYVIVPAFFLYECGLVPYGYGIVAAIGITLASGYQFCQTDAKTDDHFFKGFPSYWNVVVFYLFMLRFPPWVNLVILLALAVAVFVPVRYLYPSRTRVLRPLTLMLTVVWGVLLVSVLWRYPDHNPVWLHASLLYVAYYFVVSGYLTLRRDSAVA